MLLSSTEEITKSDKESQTEIIVNKSDELSTTDPVPEVLSSKVVVQETSVPESQQPSIVVDTTPVAPTPVEITNVSTSSNAAPAITPTNTTSTAPALVFNPVDSVKTYSSTDISSHIKNTTEHALDAPKTIERLEQISDMRHEQRKLESMEDEDADTIQIHQDTNLHLNTHDVHDISKKLDLQPAPLLGEITTLA